ncbi:hypothetical protein PC9H_009167 [Pleurotus ostreatus]|uniref:Uncharacterized protein n=2 Tax=Pleurotus ostreatus TaxID=5322 RepID=A0A8H6ZMC1_PLEOS|nr:uncharacterized protein PC9H_011240 [Pleurotus ostreatus]XP_036630102.1 uncharacterized protein PC9H_009167 [Pleurotus ostreatus]KAF7420722.1 hypothetical protein PC9H_011240 [Pleurotus ostreatus]KAF7426798.1 hypothetical protein PC9H_009167 [Pleurotus ostreatus]
MCPMGHSKSTSGCLVPTRAPEHFRLEEMQLQLAALVVDKDKAARDNATLVAENMDKRGRAKRSAVLTIPDSNEARELGKKLAIMCEAWSDSTTLLKPRPDLDPDSEERYVSFETYKLGITSAIYDFIPAKYHSFLQARSDWCSLLRRKQGEGRADALKYIKRAAPQIFKDYGIPARDWTSPTTRADSTIIQSLLKFPGDKEYPEVPPLVYPDLVSNPRKVFCNPILGRILRVILFGIASLDKATVQTSTLGKMWGINELTPGSLAFAVIAAIYVLSPDSSLNETGLVSLIPYRKIYYKIKGTLVLHPDSPPIRKAFRLHAVTVFEGITHSSTVGSGTTAPAESQHGVHSLRDALRDIESSDDEPYDYDGSQNPNDPYPEPPRPPAAEYETFNLDNVIDSDIDDSDPTPAAADNGAPPIEPFIDNPQLKVASANLSATRRGGKKVARAGRGRGKGAATQGNEEPAAAPQPRRVSHRTRS